MDLGSHCQYGSGSSRAISCRSMRIRILNTSHYFLLNIPTWFMSQQVALSQPCCVNLSIWDCWRGRGNNTSQQIYRLTFHKLSQDLPKSSCLTRKKTRICSYWILQHFYCPLKKLKGNVLHGVLNFPPQLLVKGNVCSRYGSAISINCYSSKSEFF